MGAFVALLDTIEEMTHKICPFIAGGVLLGSIYWIAITYGAVTVMQVSWFFEMSKYCYLLALLLSISLGFIRCHAGVATFSVKSCSLCVNPG